MTLRISPSAFCLHTERPGSLDSLVCPKVASLLSEFWRAQDATATTRTGCFRPQGTLPSYTLNLIQEQTVDPVLMHHTRSFARVTAEGKTHPYLEKTATVTKNSPAEDLPPLFGVSARLVHTLRISFDDGHADLEATAAANFD